jgi:hypothetical protein
MELIAWILLGLVVLGLVVAIIDGNSVRIPRSPRVGP